MSKPISKIDLPAASRRPACRQTEQTAQVGKLIAELCPEGVEFKELAEVATITIGEFVHKNKQNPNGKYPVYNGGTSETGFYDEYNNTGNKIIMSARGANAGFVNKILDKFDALVNDTTPPLQAPLHRRGKTPPLQAPLQGRGKTPPLQAPLQGRGISESIPAEISLRRKQYEYYRDKLLSFKPFPSRGGVAGEACRGGPS